MSEENDGGVRLNITAEECCEQCEEIVHNHLDCPVCNERHSPSQNYHSLWEDPAPRRISCECGATFETADDPYDPNTIWRRVAGAA